MPVVRTEKLGDYQCTNIRFPRHLHEAAWVYAIENRVKFNDVIVEAVRQFLDRNPPKRIRIVEDE